MTRVRTTIADLGERALIELISKSSCVGQQPDGAFGIGDDCASLAAAPGEAPSGETIMTTDLLIENTHFLRNDETDWYLVGYKAAAANISDLAAAGSKPRALLIAIGLPPDFPVDALTSLYRGLQECAKATGTRILGGDTTRAAALTISVTAIGWKAVTWSTCRRSDARLGDKIYVTGPLGASRAAVELLLSRELPNEITEPSAAALRRRHFVPPSRVDAGLCLAQSGQRTAIIDISDSLYNDARLVAEASKVQITLNLDAIPVDSQTIQFCQATKRNPPQFALFSGEEYELLFTSALSIEKLNEQFHTAGVKCALSSVGTVNPGSGVRLLQGGNPVDPSDETFVHFS